MTLQRYGRGLLLLPVILWLAACTAAQTFTPAARAGDTVALAVGLKKNLIRQNMTVTITPSVGAPITYAPNDPRVRAVVNLYPDPVSRAVVGTQTDQSLGYDGNTTGLLINSFVPNDNEWWQTTLILDLPTSISAGTATISINDGLGTAFLPSYITIVPGVGESNKFQIYNWIGSGTFKLLDLYPNVLLSMERADNKAVTFSGTIIPHSIQFEFSHTPAVGKTWIVNPRGDIKNVLWTDTGSNVRVILTPAAGTTLAHMINFKFYISGGITGITPTNLKAYDINGSPVSGVSFAIQ